MNILNLLVAFLQVLAVALIPFVLWNFQKKYQDRKDKKEAKLRLFFTLMKYRKPNINITEEYVNALNTIDIVFQDSPQIRASWKEFSHTLLDDHSALYSQQDKYLLKLLSDMARSLGYQDLNIVDLSNYYFPIELKNKADANRILTQQLLREPKKD